MKASAVAIVETPSLNGHMLFGYFYPSKTPGVDVSVALESPTKDTVMMKVVDAEIKSTDYIADEIKTRGKEIREGGNETQSATRRAKILNALPVFLRSALETLFRFIGAGLGLNIPFLGIIAYPLGVCSVITLPGGDGDVDICILPESTDSAAMVTVAIGGIRIQPSYDADKKISAIPVLNISVTIDCHACSLAEGRKFCARLQQYMNNPALLDKFDRKFAVTQEDEIIASNAGKTRK
jgi:pyruvate/2-oxoglutarate dehydrogenase complex dihydrolipoamide acyltransferase (E2) component